MIQSVKNCPPPPLPSLPLHRRLNFLHLDQFLTTYQVLFPSIFDLNGLFSPACLICGHDSLTQRRITCYWLEGQTALMRKGIMGFHFRASWLSNTKVSLCVCVLMIHCFFSMPFIFSSHQILQPVIDSAALSLSLSLSLLSLSLSLSPLSILLFSLHVTLRHDWCRCHKHLNMWCIQQEQKDSHLTAS